MYGPQMPTNVFARSNIIQTDIFTYDLFGKWSIDLYFSSSMLCRSHIICINYQLAAEDDDICFLIGNSLS